MIPSTKPEQPTVYPGENGVCVKGTVYELSSGASFKVTKNNAFVAYPTVLQFIVLFPKLTGVRLWPWQNKLNTILTTWCRNTINNQNPKISCSFEVNIDGNIYASYLSPYSIEIKLWRNQGEYSIEIKVFRSPFRGGYYYDIIRNVIELGRLSIPFCGGIV